MATATTTKPRVWLAGEGGRRPTDRPVVRDGLGREWRPVAGWVWCTADGRHHETWDGLRARFDLVEAIEGKEAA